jgi:hypothetical protein
LSHPLVPVRANPQSHEHLAHWHTKQTCPQAWSLPAPRHPSAPAQGRCQRRRDRSACVRTWHPTYSGPFTSCPRHVRRCRHRFPAVASRLQHSLGWWTRPPT